MWGRCRLDSWPPQSMVRTHRRAGTCAGARTACVCCADSSALLLLLLRLCRRASGWRRARARARPPSAKRWRAARRAGRARLGTATPGGRGAATRCRALPCVHSCAWLGRAGVPHAVARHASNFALPFLSVTAMYMCVCTPRLSSPLPSPSPAVVAPVGQLDTGQQSVCPRSCTQKPHLLSGRGAPDADQICSHGHALRHHDQQVLIRQGGARHAANPWGVFVGRASVRVRHWQQTACSVLSVWHCHGLVSAVAHAEARCEGTILCAQDHDASDP